MIEGARIDMAACANSILRPYPSSLTFPNSPFPLFSLSSPSTLDVSKVTTKTQ